jgi:ribonuclease HI
VLVAVQKGNTEIATDNASPLFQISRKQQLNPMAVLHHLHRELLKDIVNLVHSSPSTITFYKMKLHSGIIGNEGADHLAHKAAVNQNSNISLPPATDPFYEF